MDNNHVLTSESEKEYNAVLTDDFVEGLCKMPLTREQVEIESEPNLNILSNSNRDKTDDNNVSEVLTSESDKEYGASLSFNEYIRNFDLESLENSTKNSNSNMNNSKDQKEVITGGKVKDNYTSSDGLTNVTERNIESYEKKRKNEKLSGAVVVTPHKIHKPEIATNNKPKSNNAQKLPGNTLRQSETLLSVRSIKHDNTLKGENSYLNNKIISLENRFFVKGRIVTDIPQLLKDLNRKVSFEKRVYYESVSNYEQFMQKINGLRKNKKSKNPYLHEYSVLQREEAYIPNYVDLVKRNCSDLNNTLALYHKTFKDWTDSYEH